MQNDALVLTPPIREAIPLWRLFVLYLKIGLTGFGPAVAAETKKRLVKGLGWVTEDEFAHGLALAQMLPGTVFVSLTVYVGYKLRGVAGALTSFVGFLLPPFSLMLSMSYLYFTYGSLPKVTLLFQGISVTVVGLVAYAVVDIGKTLIKDVKDVVIAIAAAGLIFVYPNIFIVLSLAGVAGLFFYRSQFARQTPEPANSPPFLQTVGPKVFRPLAVIVATGSVAFVFLGSLQPLLLKLCTVFFRMALFMFGGGFSMIPFFQQEVVENYKWLTLDEFTVGLALGQVTPGPILISATFVGYKVARVAGACAATLGVFLPSFVFVMLTAEIYKVIVNATWVKAVIKGIAVAFPGMIFVVAIGLARHAVVDISSAAFAVIPFLVLVFGKIDTILVVLCGTLGYYLFHLIH